MSALWLVQVVCDDCQRRALPIDADRANYGRTLTARRAELADIGWHSYTSAGPHQHRDWCPQCAAARGIGA